MSYTQPRPAYPAEAKSLVRLSFSILASGWKQLLDKAISMTFCSINVWSYYA